MAGRIPHRTRTSIIDGAGRRLLKLTDVKLLIVNADDFGLSERVNQGIIEAHQQGLVTSTSLMANGDAFDQAVALTRTAPTLGVGIHLNLTDGRPLSPAAQIPSLVTKDLMFEAGPIRLVQKLLAGTARLSHIERELRAQIERTLAAGIVPTHLDGHQHVHAWPSVSAMVIRLAVEYGIRGIRCSAEHPVDLTGLLGRHPQSRGSILWQIAIGRALAFLTLRQRGHMRQAGLVYPSRFYGFTHTGYLDESALQMILRNIQGGSSELMCHPGYLDQALDSGPTRLKRQRERELVALTHPAMKSLVSQLGIRLGTYRDLFHTQP